MKTPIFHIKNLVSGRLVKDAITGKRLEFADKAEAESYARSMQALAISHPKPAKFVVVEA
ncbi:hypothetical protein F6X40_09490 [Paraburkholderia sp. UCT31]|uniref:hypothetical protein n=1 Tax=Paraburkholderia sp. UCT31 TaxID=2615209 RepID=UPI001656155E|nr:hypothetical protein [Paraburkholderia sp. UCT31]MBC8737041.1 hypothetical protein [Paraburkholderia sp. UCT31]